jgi:hypothetical protein
LQRRLLRLKLLALLRHCCLLQQQGLVDYRAGTGRHASARPSQHDLLLLLLRGRARNDHHLLRRGSLLHNHNLHTHSTRQTTLSRVVNTAKVRRIPAHRRLPSCLAPCPPATTKSTGKRGQICITQNRQAAGRQSAHAHHCCHLFELALVFAGRGRAHERTAARQRFHLLQLRLHRLRGSGPTAQNEAPTDREKQASY